MKCYLIALSLLVCACGTDRVETVLVPVAQPGAPAVSCEVFDGQASLPTSAQVLGTYTLGLPSVSLGEVDGTINPVTGKMFPFAAFKGTAAEGVVENFALRCKFKYNVAFAGTYTFRLNSDDGSELWVDGTRRINNGGSHGMTLVSGNVAFTAAQLGNHDLEVRYFEGGGPKGLILTVQEPPRPAPSPTSL